MHNYINWMLLLNWLAVKLATLAFLNFIGTQKINLGNPCISELLLLLTGAVTTPVTHGSNNFFFNLSVQIEGWAGLIQPWTKERVKIPLAGVGGGCVCQQWGIFDNCTGGSCDFLPCHHFSCASLGIVCCWMQPLKDELTPCPCPRKEHCPVWNAPSCTAREAASAGISTLSSSARCCPHIWSSDPPGSSSCWWALLNIFIYGIKHILTKLVTIRSFFSEWSE